MQKFFENASAQVYYDESLDTLFLEYTNKVVSHEQFVVINTAVLHAFIKLQTKVGSRSSSARHDKTSPSKRSDSCSVYGRSGNFFKNLCQ